MEVLETERLRLRWMTVADAPFLLELMNDPAFITHVADRGLRTVADAANYIAEKFLPHYAEHGFGSNVVILKATGDRSSGRAVCSSEPTLDEVDIGYAFLPAYRGLGLAYEAAAAVLAHGHAVLKIPRIAAITSLTNEDSIKLLEKLGLHFERTFQMPGYEGESKLFLESAAR